jgi:hypothetical protein
MRRAPAQNLLPLLATTLLIALLVPGSLSAQEVIVKNDSVSDFGTAAIVGDFVAGEEAGAVLTMPQNGTIVGVQIFWRSGNGVSGYSIENAIHIYDGSTFPTPGTELETVVAPVLEDGWLNEFRYLDDNMTIPLSVPVTAGLNIMITLEYANSTNWNQSIPALATLIGTNMFTLSAADVTPAPYNQPPYPASGDVASDVCSVVGIAP